MKQLPLLLILSAWLHTAIADEFQASLDGYQAAQPASLSLPGSTAQARLKTNGNFSIDYSIRYTVAPVNGTDPTQIHLHFSRPRTNGGVVAFVCSNLGNAPAGTPSCPATSGTLSGTWTSDDIVEAASAQGIAAGEIGEVIAAMKRRATYLCIHTLAFAGGSIRGRVRGGGNNDDD